MTNLKNKTTEIVATKIRPFKGWSILLGLVLVGTTAGAALASNSGAKGHKFDATFTKWVTTSSPAAGVVANLRAAHARTLARDLAQPHRRDRERADR